MRADILWGELCCGTPEQTRICLLLCCAGECPPREDIADVVRANICTKSQRNDVQEAPHSIASLSLSGGNISKCPVLPS